MKNDLIDGSNGMILDGIFASQVWDSSGEVLDIEGCDISEMVEGRGLANYEHRNDESTGATSQDIVGKIVYAKKIIKESDAEDERQKMFWNKIKVPFIYGMVRLYDGAGHLSAQGLAAQIRDAVKNKEQILVRFSIDGSTLERDGNHLKRTIARRVALTIKPCNKTCDSDLVVDPNAPEGYDKKPQKPLASMVKKEHPLYGRLGTSGEIEQDAPEQHSLWKALKAKTPTKSKLPSQWETEDGIVIPRAGTPDRKRWDVAYEKALKQHFGGGGKRVKIKVDEALNNNPIRNYDRYNMYLQMAQHDVLPPAVVRRTGMGQWEVVDGNHRHFAAKKAGLDTMDAIDITGVRKSEQEIGMKKAMDAGMAVGPPSSLSGGAALQREELAKRLVKLAQAYDDSKGSMRDFLKSQLPEVSDHYLDHFTDLATDIRARLRKAEPLAKARKKAEGAPAEAPVVAKTPKAAPKPTFTVRGEGVKPAGLSGSEMTFNEHTGQLNTKNGQFHLYNPDADGDSGDKFRQVWKSPEVRRQHDYAVGNWIKVNQALKEGRLPEAVLATSVAFSQLSPNTPVAMHEYMYAHLLDTFKNKGIDIRSPQFSSPEVKQDWLSRDQPHAWPESSRDYFTQQIGDLVTNQSDSKATGRLAGERGAFMLAHNKFANMARYADAHQHMKDLVARHGVDGRSAVAELMANKGKAELWEATRKRALDKGKPDPGPFQGLHIPGLAPKTARFAYAMLGAGNSFVPDTHFSRHLFGLDKDLDKNSIHHLRDEVIWNHKNSDLLSAMDRWYYRNHPAVKLMMEHPEFGSYFKDNPEQAVFPAFWGHWLAISGHERLMGHRLANVAQNQSASHRPLFDEVGRLMSDPKESKQTIPARTTPLPESPAPQSNLRFFFKKSEDSGPLIDPRLAAALIRHWIDNHGEEEASFRYYSQLIPLLMHESKDKEDPLLKAERLSVDLRKLTTKLTKADGGRSLGLARERDLVGENPKTIAPIKVSAADGVDSVNNTPEQKALIDGVDLSRNLKAKPVHVTESLTSPTQMWIPHPDGKRLVLVKHGHEWSYPHMGARETAYHNLARDVFGLGDYVPLTAMANHPGGWEMSMQEMVKNPEHHNSGSDAHLKTLMQLGDAGELHKLAAMNYILGNDDRHGNNYLFSRGDDAKLSLKLIDHGHTFRNTAEGTDVDFGDAGDGKPGLQPRELRKPHYLKVYEFEKARPAAEPQGRFGDKRIMEPVPSQIHPRAVEWLRNLDGVKLKSKMEEMGLGDRAIKGVMRDFHALRNSWTRPGATTQTPTPWSDRNVFESRDFAPTGQELHSDKPEDWQRRSWSGMKPASTSGPTRKLKKADDEDDEDDDEECSECGVDHIHVGSYIIEHCHHDEGSHLCIYSAKTGEKLAETEISKDLDDVLHKGDKPFHGYNKNRHSRTGGLSDAYRKKVNREEGSNLKRPVTGKVKAGSKAAKRRKSFCARMSGAKGPTSKDGKLTPKGAALKRWKCSKSDLEKSEPEGIGALSSAEFSELLKTMNFRRTPIDTSRPKDKV